MINIHEKENWKKEYAKYLWKSIPDLGALMMIDNEGNLIEHKNSVQFEKDYGLPWLRYIAKKISLRFKIVDFHKEMEGLQLTINVFKNHAMLVKELNLNYILVLILPPTNANSLTAWIRDNAEWLTEEFIFEDNFVLE